ncbi:MAG: hypothetical protein JW770_07385 [Actinobacteria bacterium]|nr:hypothetical protein [Actinomycetota bacterium]
MGFLNSIKNFFAAPADTGSRFVVFKVKCDRCGEEITVRASKTSDISRVYESETHGDAEYFLRKEILGNKCNNLIYADIYFGPGFNIISKDITGGKFLE